MLDSNVVISGYIELFYLALKYFYSSAQILNIWFGLDLKQCTGLLNPQIYIFNTQFLSYSISIKILSLTDMFKTTNYTIVSHLN